MNVNKQHRVVVGWCSGCGMVCIGGPEARCRCPDCGGPLRHITIYTDSEEPWRYTGSMYESHPEREGGPTLTGEAVNTRTATAALAEEEARYEDGGDGDASDIIKELFCELFHNDGYEGCPLYRKSGDTTDSDELPDEGELRVFVVTPTPFLVWMRGKDWKDTAHVLRGDIEELTIAGFPAAVKEGSVHLSAMPVSDNEDAPGIVMLEKIVHEQWIGSYGCGVVPQVAWLLLRPEGERPWNSSTATSCSTSRLRSFIPKATRFTGLLPSA